MSIGRYIDGCSEAARDRIITEQNWGSGRLVSYDNKRCLVGISCDAIGSNGFCLKFRDVIEEERWSKLSNQLESIRLKHSVRFPTWGFDALVERVGLARAVALCKQRAAKKINRTIDFILNPNSEVITMK